MGAGYLREITDVDLTTEPTDGQVLLFNASKNKWKAGAGGAVAGADRIAVMNSFDDLVIYNFLLDF